jgi:hypothetical protein
MTVKELNEAVSFLKRYEKGKPIDWGKLSDGALAIIANMATSNVAKEAAQKEVDRRAVAV